MSPDDSTRDPDEINADLDIPDFDQPLQPIDPEAETMEIDLELVDKLRNTPIFHGVSEAGLIILSRTCQEVVKFQGQTLFEKDIRTNGFYLNQIAGQVIEVIFGEDFADTHELKENEPIGQFNALDGINLAVRFSPSTTVKTKSTLRLLFFDKNLQDLGLSTTDLSQIIKNIIVDADYLQYANDLAQSTESPVFPPVVQSDYFPQGAERTSSITYNFLSQGDPVQPKTGHFVYCVDGMLTVTSGNQIVGKISDGGIAFEHWAIASTENPDTPLPPVSITSNQGSNILEISFEDDNRTPEEQLHILVALAKAAQSKVIMMNQKVSRAIGKDRAADAASIRGQLSRLPVIGPALGKLLES